MVFCKDCIHDGLCSLCIDPVTEEHIDYGIACVHFKDCSKFVELPCEVGDMVYAIDFGQISEYIVEGVCYYKWGNELRFAIFVRIYNGVKGLNASGINLSKHTAVFVDHFYNTQIGKTVFLTKEEAEQALREREKNG